MQELKKKLKSFFFRNMNEDFLTHLKKYEIRSCNSRRGLGIIKKRGNIKF